MKKIGEAPRWFIIALLLGAVAMMFSAVLKAQDSTKGDSAIFVPVKVVPSSTLGIYSGRTQCDSTGKIEILIADNVSPDLEPEILAHEAVHVLQIRSRPSCKWATGTYLADKRFAFELEIEAYCVENQMFSENHDDFLASVDKMSSWFWVSNRANFPSYEALKARVVAVCYEDSPNTPKVEIVPNGILVSRKGVSNVPP